MFNLPFPFLIHLVALAVALVWLAVSGITGKTINLVGKRWRGPLIVGKQDEDNRYFIGTMFLVGVFAFFLLVFAIYDRHSN